jgi:uncharacterized repeat protein (TIGR01451 family)
LFSGDTPGAAGSDGASLAGGQGGPVTQGNVASGGGGGGGYYGGGGGGSGIYSGGGGGGSSFGAGPGLTKEGAATGPASVTISYQLLPADLALTNTASPNPVLSGNKLTYTITATNPGGLGASGVTVKDELPAAAHFISASATQGNCAGPGGPKGGTVTCSLGNLAGGASATVTITVTVTKPGTLSDTATVTATNVTGDSDDSATATVIVQGT